MYTLTWMIFFLYIYLIYCNDNNFFGGICLGQATTPQPHWSRLGIGKIISCPTPPSLPPPPPHSPCPFMCVFVLRFGPELLLVLVRSFLLSNTLTSDGIMLSCFSSLICELFLRVPQSSLAPIPLTLNKKQKQNTNDE